MPTSVPRIQDSAQLDTSLGRQRSQGDHDAFGAQEGRGLQVLGQGIDRVRVAAEEIDDNFNEANARELDNQLSARIRDRLYNTESGYLSTQRGRNALDQRAQVEADIDAAAAELLPQARNPRAAAMFQQVARERVARALGGVATYAAEQNTAYQNEVSEARLNEFQDNAVAAYADPVAVNEQIVGAIGALQPDGTRSGGEIEAIAQRNGWDEEITAQKRRQFQSELLSSVVVNLATTDPVAAEEMMVRIRPELTAQAAGELLTTVRAAQAQARERTTGAIWQALANGQDPRQLAEWEEFSTNPLYGREHETFNEYRRQRAASATTNAYSTRVSEAAADELEATGALTPRVLMLVTDYATGRINVGPRRPRQPAPDMTPEQFQRETGMTPQRARTLFDSMNNDDLLRVLNRRNGQTDNAAVDRANEDILRIAEPMAQSMGLVVTGTTADNAERRGAFQAYIYREASAYVQQHGERPDDAAIQAIARRALLHVNAHGRTRNDRGEPVTGGDRYAFEPVPYSQIPREERNAIENNLRLSLGARPTHAQVEARYAEFLRAQQ